MKINTDTTMGRISAGHLVKEAREGGSTWKQVEEELGIKPDLGRTLVKEAEEYDAKKAKLRVVETESTEPPVDDPAVAKAKQILRDGGEPKAKAPARSGRYVKATCGCGTVIRLSQTNLDKGSITCTECKKPFTAS